MLNNLFLEKFYANEEIRKIPLGLQSTVAKGLEEVLEDLWEEKHLVSIAQLLNSASVKGTGAKQSPNVKGGAQ